MSAPISTLRLRVRTISFCVSAVLLLWAFTPAYSSNASDLAFLPGKPATDQFVFQVGVMKVDSGDTSARDFCPGLPPHNFIVRSRKPFGTVQRFFEFSALERNPIYIHPTINAP